MELKTNKDKNKKKVYICIKDKIFKFRNYRIQLKN